MNRENILKVAAAIEHAAKPKSRPKFGFNMHQLVGQFYPDKTGHECKTSCCIAGWAAYLRSGRVPTTAHTIVQRAAEFLGLEDDADLTFGLFFGDYSLPTEIELEDIEPAHAVAVLRHLAKTGKVDWTVGAPS